MTPDFTATSPGELIRTARVARGLTQQQLARRAGSTQSALSRIETGRISPTVSTLERYLRAADSQLIILYRPKG